ncbi:MAG: hypothetical protein WCL30_05850, partial [Pseudomonadota bacterium]
IFAFLYALPLYAGDEGEGKITIIDGKKFFSLSEARRFTGTPVQPVIIKPVEKKSPIIPAAKKAAPLTPTNNLKTGDTNKDSTAKDILEIFSPADKIGNYSSIKK